tara:strand:+ start:78121 stop:80058 length:1938 start_codon:yes stop_codon:yes gene_type:complete
MIKNVKAINFLSWSELSFDIKKGVTLIDGFNRDDQTSEGSGKSAVLNAIAWGLYGKIPKDANIDDVIKSGTKKCVVSIECEEFNIIRSRNKNDLYIMTASGEKLKGKDVRETQKMIEDLIGMTFDTFCQTVYFAQNYPKKFITAPQEDKGKILSEVQDLQIFDKARAEVMKLLKKENSSLQNLQMQLQEKTLLAQGALRELELLVQQSDKDKAYRENQLTQYDDQIMQKENQIQQLDTEIQNLEITKSNMASLSNEKVTQLNSEIANFNQAVAAIRHKLTDVDSHNRKLDQLKSDQQKNLSEKTRADNNIVRLEEEAKRLEHFIANPDANCPTCGHEVDAPDMSQPTAQLAEVKDSHQMYVNQAQEIYNRINEQSDAIGAFVLSNANELNQDLTNINQEISNRQRQLTAHNSSTAEYARISSKIDSNQNFIANVATELYNLKNQKAIFLEQPQTDYSAQIQEKDESVTILRNEATQVQHLLDTKTIYMNQLETLKNGFKEVKSYTFNSLLAELTIKSNRYLQELFEVPVTIRFTNDNMKINTEVTMNGEARGLGLLSGGQFRRTSLAVDLALSEIVALRTGSKMNIRILDEYFKDLSESSMEKCLRLLEKLGGATILIEHNSIFKSIVDNVFECELIDGTTRAVA